MFLSSISDALNRYRTRGAFLFASHTRGVSSIVAYNFASKLTPRNVASLSHLSTRRCWCARVQLDGRGTRAAPISGRARSCLIKSCGLGISRAREVTNSRLTTGGKGSTGERKREETRARKAKEPRGVEGNADARRETSDDRRKD